MPRLLTLLCLAALAAPGALAAQDSTKPAPKPKRNPDVISAQEIEAAPPGARDGLALVKELRPLWLRTRGEGSVNMRTPEPQVYVSGVKRGGVNTLEDVQRDAIKEIQHLRGTDAMERYGVGHDSGAILVILK